MDGDLISRKALKSELKKREWEFCFPLIEIDEVIDEMPAVDAEPVRQGTWELVTVGVNGHITAYHGCSVCGCVFKSPSHYCPNCGAKMDGDEK